MQRYILLKLFHATVPLRSVHYILLKTVASHCPIKEVCKDMYILLTIVAHYCPIKEACKDTFCSKLLHATVPLRKRAKIQFCLKLLGHQENNGLWHSIERRPSTKGMHLDREIFKGRLQKPTKKSNVSQTIMPLPLLNKLQYYARKEKSAMTVFFSLGEFEMRAMQNFM